MIGIFKGKFKGKECTFIGSVVPEDYLYYGSIPKLDKLVDSDNVEDRLLAVKKHYALEVLCNDPSWRVRLAVCKLGWDLSNFINDPSKRVQKQMEIYKNRNHKLNDRRIMTYSENRKKHLKEYAKKHDLPVDGTYNYKGQIIHYDHILSYEKDKKIETIEKYNLFPEGSRKITFDGFIPANKIHRFAHHLNSSQVLCYNFFRPMVKDDHTPEQKLIELLKEQGIAISENAKCCFEYDGYADYKEGTEYDFYIFDKEKEIQVYFEIKYAENGFGGAKRDNRHKEKYDNTYRKMLKECQCLKSQDVTFEEFCKNYQLYRNVLRLTKRNHYSIIITSKGNMTTNKQLDEFLKNINEPYRKNVIALYWEDLIEKNHPLYEKYIAEYE